ncbi:hypothetical protein PHSY_005977 [Pseudozyma hubeiensis SY62]|uniref:Uncharacterized protein n=1 Tax=Pseudozyma hubeiensis (strain SY62) TaxID=1305764 RepID=R9PAH2_PSEHS|nr:hypothetical protein PHSY_005977 [Pseudozyma hubeiensis SY62]GAC98383.1 hypothetical protein PHSY_005977 [Pseudozyma hubeiensis SY62]
MPAAVDFDSLDVDAALMLMIVVGAIERQHSDRRDRGNFASPQMTLGHLHCPFALTSSCMVNSPGAARLVRNVRCQDER